MSEKRFRNVFVYVEGNTEIMLEDKEEEFFYEAVSPLVERLLNYLDVEMKKLKEENKQLRKQVLEYDMILQQHEFAEKEGFR